MSLGQVIVSAGARNEIALGGLLWRVKSVCTADLIAAGGNIVYAARAAREAKDAPPTPTLEQLKGVLRFADALLIAGVEACAAPTAQGVTPAWEPIRFVATEPEQDAAANVVWVGSVARPVRDGLGEAVLAVSEDGGAAAARIGRFLGGESRSP